ncbi:MAG: hypothetical protein J5735_01720 [Prevotella sp.]|nr:hypothetical protein [Prevotella sp.]
MKIHYLEEFWPFTIVHRNGRKIGISVKNTIYIFLGQPLLVQMRSGCILVGFYETNREIDVTDYTAKCNGGIAKSYVFFL